MFSLHISLHIEKDWRAALLRPLGLQESVVKAFSLPPCLLMVFAPPATKTVVMQPHSVDVQICCDG